MKKLARGNELEIGFVAVIKKYFSQNDILYNDEILALKKQDITLTEKIEKAKEIIQNLAIQHANDIENTSINIDYSSVSIDYDSIEWEKLLVSYYVGNKIKLMDSVYSENSEKVPVGSILTIIEIEDLYAGFYVAVTSEGIEVEVTDEDFVLVSKN